MFERLTIDQSSLLIPKKPGLQPPLDCGASPKRKHFECCDLRAGVEEMLAEMAPDGVYNIDDGRFTPTAYDALMAICCVVQDMIIAFVKDPMVGRCKLKPVLKAPRVSYLNNHVIACFQPSAFKLVYIKLY